MANRVFTDPKPTQYRKDGVTVNSGGYLYFYEAGETSTTPKEIFADKNLTAQLKNPVRLDDNGRWPAIYLKDEDYAVVLKDSDGVQVWRVNNYQPAVLGAQFEDFSASVTYSINDIVRYTDGKYYKSEINNNIGNAPPSSPESWSEIFFITVYNPTVNYSVNDIVYYNGKLYTSISSNNQDNTPDTSFIYWNLQGQTVQDISGLKAANVTYVFDNFTGGLNVSLNSFPTSTDFTVGETGSGSDFEYGEAPAGLVSVTVLFRTQSRYQGTSAATSINVKSNPTDPTYHTACSSIVNETSDSDYNWIYLDVPVGSDGKFVLSYSMTNTGTGNSASFRIMGFKARQ